METSYAPLAILRSKGDWGARFARACHCWDFRASLWVRAVAMRKSLHGSFVSGLVLSRVIYLEINPWFARRFSIVYMCHKQFLVRFLVFSLEMNCYLFSWVLTDMESLRGSTCSRIRKWWKYASILFCWMMAPLVSAPFNLWRHCMS